MRRVFFFFAWSIWIAMVTMAVVFMRFIVDPIFPPSSVTAGFFMDHFSLGAALNEDVDMLGWGLEWVLAAHLLAYLAWRAFKAVFLR